MTYDECHVPFGIHHGLVGQPLHQPEAGAANPFTVQQRLYVEVLYNPKGSGIGNTLTRLMFALEQGGYMARYAPTGDRVLVLGKRRA